MNKAIIETIFTDKVIPTLNKYFSYMCSETQKFSLNVVEENENGNLTVYIKNNFMNENSGYQESFDIEEQECEFIEFIRTLIEEDEENEDYLEELKDLEILKTIYDNRTNSMICKGYGFVFNSISNKEKQDYYESLIREKRREISDLEDETMDIIISKQETAKNEDKELFFQCNTCHSKLNVVYIKHHTCSLCRNSLHTEVNFKTVQELEKQISELKTNLVV